MESYGVTIDDVRNNVIAANLEIPGGRIDESSREYLVRIKGRLEHVNDFNNIIALNKNGTPVYLSDIAIVSDTIVEQRSLSRYNGEIAIGLDVVKQSGANVVDMAEQAKKVIEALQKEMPPDISIIIVDDNSRFITDSIHEIIFNIEFGTLLAVLVIFLFLLDFKPTIITGLSIPISVIATFSLMKLLGFSVNIMTLLGLSLSVGILIDDAIVVVENIYRHLDEGKTPIQAAFSGTNEIGLAVMATTFSIMVVFLPVAFMEGIIGRFFYQFGMTVAFAVLISLFVAFSLTPMLSSRWLAQKSENNNNKKTQKHFIVRFWLKVKHFLNYWNIAFDAFKPYYTGLLKLPLRHRWLVVVVAVFTFVVAIWMGSFLGSEFMPQTDEGKVYLTVETPPGTNLTETSQRISEVEKIINNLSEVKESYVTIGSGNKEVTEGRVLFKLTDVSERTMSALELADSIRILSGKIAGIKYAVSIGAGEGGGDYPIEISIRGEDRDELTRLAHKVEKIFVNTPGTTDIDNSLQEGKPEIQITVDRRLADDLGISLAMIPQTVRTLVEGDVVTRYKDGNEEYDVRLKLDDRFRSSTNDISRIMIESDKKLPDINTFQVPLNRLATLNKSTAIGEYRRYDRQNEVKVYSNVLTGAFAGTVATLILSETSKIQLPPGYIITTVGQAEMMEESFKNIFSALALAIIFIYLVLASQYESFFDPFSIMLSLPLSLIGAIIALLITGTSLSIMSLIGIVMLMGLVTKNAILLIDFVKQRREKGVPRFDAVLIAGPIRLRPILMTTLATVFGMLPLALGIGPGAELRAPMARAAIGGMISSTILTLVVVPVVYTIIDDIVIFFRRITGKKQPVIIKEFLTDEQLDRAQ